MTRYRRSSACAIAFAALLITGCSVFKDEGAACRGDTNCPGDQVCCGGTCAKSCNIPGSLVVSVTLATDFVPGYEFDTVSVQLDSESRQLTVTPVTELVSPRPIGQFVDVRDGRHSITAALTQGGSAVALRVITFSTNGSDTTVPFVLARTCAGVSCTAGNADQCSGGTCVPRACSDLDADACPPPACEADSDCLASDNCTTGACVSGQCLQRRRDTTCATGQRCIPGTGCIQQKHECDVEVECDDLVACTQERCENNHCTSTRDDTRCGTTVCDPTAKTADPTTGCTPAPCSQDNCHAGPCETATCDGGQCKRNKVCQDNEQCCDGVCAVNCNDPRGCAGRTSGYVCRVAVGTCDVPEVCDGASDVCPPDVRVQAGVVCRAKGGDCDVAEICDGVANVCPDNVLTSAGTVCRAVSDICDTAEACTGQSSACPVDAFAPTSLVCRTSAGPCDPAETCTSRNAACPADRLTPAGNICRDIAGVCDVAESCTGTSAGCPSDVFQPTTTVCRASQGVCDVIEKCNGDSAACPADAKSTAQCRGVSGPCDIAESCNGASDTCPADQFAGASTVCRAAGGTCDVAESCTGASAACPADGGGNVGTVCAAAPSVCFANAVCNGAPTCPGNPVNVGAQCASDACSMTLCDAGGSCTNRQATNEGVCCGTCAICASGGCTDACVKLGGPPTFYCASSGSAAPLCGCGVNIPF